MGCDHRGSLSLLVLLLHDQIGELDELKGDRKTCGPASCWYQRNV